MNNRSFTGKRNALVMRLLSRNHDYAQHWLSFWNDAIKLLNPDDAKMITLFYKGEQTLEEIGQIMGIEPNAAKVRLHRARQRLKEKMEKYFMQEVKDLDY